MKIKLPRPICKDCGKDLLKAESYINVTATIDTSIDIGGGARLPGHDHGFSRYNSGTFCNDCYQKHVEAYGKMIANPKVSIHNSIVYNNSPCSTCNERYG